MIKSTPKRYTETCRLIFESLDMIYEDYINDGYNMYDADQQAKEFAILCVKCWWSGDGNNDTIWSQKNSELSQI